MADVTLAATAIPPAGCQASDAAIRLRRASGQLLGVLRMQEAGRPCTDILDQLAAVRAALEAAAALILEEQVRETLGPDVPTRTVEEVSAMVRRFARTA